VVIGIVFALAAYGGRASLGHIVVAGTSTSPHLAGQVNGALCRYLLKICLVLVVPIKKWKTEKCYQKRFEEKRSDGNLQWRNTILPTAC